MTALCDKLFDFDAKLNIVPVLATGYEWTDSKTLLIHLRPNVQFQDGEKFDAAAVKYTLERDLNITGSFRRSEIGAMDHVEVVDPLTVRVVMKQPFSPFVAILTDRAGMMLLTEGGRSRQAKISGCIRCAPDRSASSSVSRRITSRWNASPVTGTPRASTIDRVTYRIIPDSSMRLANLQAGTLDLTEIAPLDADAVKHDPKLSAGFRAAASATARSPSTPATSRRPRRRSAATHACAMRSSCRWIARR